MFSLRDVQGEFAAALLDPDRPVPAAITTRGGAPRERRFAVYRNNVVSSLIDALGAAYPAVRRIVGDQFFRAMAGIFVRTHPPRSPVMALFGADFPAFVEQFPPASRLPYLASVARVERAWREAYDAPDADPAPLDTLSRVPPEHVADTTLAVHPSLRIVRSRWAAGSLWHANVIESDQGDGSIDVPVTTAQDVLVVRPALDVDVRILPPGNGAFLSALIGGATLGEAASRAAAEMREFDLTGAIGGIFAAGTIVGIKENVEGNRTE